MVPLDFNFETCVDMSPTLVPLIDFHIKIKGFAVHQIAQQQVASCGDFAFFYFYATRNVLNDLQSF